MACCCDGVGIAGSAGVGCEGGWLETSQQLEVALDDDRLRELSVIVVGRRFSTVGLATRRSSSPELSPVGSTSLGMLESKRLLSYRYRPVCEPVYENLVRFCPIPLRR